MLSDPERIGATAASSSRWFKLSMEDSTMAGTARVQERRPKEVRLKDEPAESISLKRSCTASVKICWRQYKAFIGGIAAVASIE